ncbi:DNA-binding FadR family transcriptional regulator [Saccharothrix tamanrassetensis]|uniref:DNA-binding FadR family transcriptional regulator n=1 Tax=Saccharothrix tamanrassetensis TaxID=1051531 RepID=A0A841CQ45_9PSEU|nr:FCD domain-containing protein [Saccharothrix tamanrassetensis]MBB5959831.1 DNA-binding FadR family transcriptional regulator [Saccharothrix tamanrassetensis]
MLHTPPIESALLAAMSSQAGPMGARAALVHLREQGFAVSESTVSRLLRELDERALTQSVGKKGRVLTEEGRRAAANLLLDSRRASNFADALNLRDVHDLVDHLVGRRGIEREAARAAALRARPEELAQLRKMVETTGSGRWQERLGFHRTIGQASHNRQIQAITTTLFDERLDPLEHLLVLIGIKQEALVRWDEEHRGIVAGISDRDPERAERLMVVHLDGMIRETEQFANSGNAHVIHAVLAEIESK